MAEVLFFTSNFDGVDTSVGDTAVDDWTQLSGDGVACYFKINQQARATRKVGSNFPRLMRPNAPTFADSVVEFIIPPNSIYTAEVVRMCGLLRHNNTTGVSYEFFVEPNSRRIRLNRNINLSSAVALTSNPTDINLSYVSFATYDVTKSYLVRFACYGSNPTNLIGQLYLLNASNEVVSKVAEATGTDTFSALQGVAAPAAFSYFKAVTSSGPIYIDNFRWSEVTGGVINADYVPVAAPNTPPTFVSGSAANISASGGSTNRITVTFSDSDGVDAASLTNAIEVVYPNASVVPAAFVSSSVSGTNRTGLWDAPAPGGAWDETDNGTYTYRLKANQLKDTQNNFTAAQDLGTFSVLIAPAGGGGVELSANSSLLVRSANWYNRGDGSIDTNYLGAYIKGSFTGATLSIKTANTDAFRSFVCQINGGSFTKFTPTAGNQTLLLATGLGAGTHTFRLVYDQRESGFTDRWNNPEMIAISFLADNFSQAPRLTGDVFIYGDSIMQYDFFSLSAVKGVGFAMGEASGHEFAMKAFGGTGWRAVGAQNAPNIETSWNFQRSGIPLQYAGAPDWVLINMGTNDGGSTNAQVQTAIVNTLTAMRARSGWGTVPLLIQVPFRQTFLSTIDAAIVALASPDTKKVNAGAHLNRNLTGTSGFYSADGLHPNPVAHPALAGGTLLSVGKALSGSGSSGGGTGGGTGATSAEVSTAVWSAPIRSLTTPGASGGQILFV